MKRGFLALRIGAGCLAVGAILWRVDPDSLFEVLGEVSPAWLGGALVVNFIAIVLSSLLWRGLIDGKRPTAMAAWKAYISGVFFNNIGLGTAIGDAFRAQSLRDGGTTAPRAVASVAAERIASLCALLILACAGAMIILPSQPLLSSAVWAGSGCIVLGLAAAVLFATGLRTMARIPAPVRVRLTEGVEAMRALVRQRAAMVHAGLLALLVQGCTVIATLLVLRSIGADVTVVEALTIVPVIALAVLIPVSVQGIGVRETAYVSMFGIVGVSPEQALAAALLSYVTTLIVSFVGGAVVAYDLAGARGEGARGPATHARIEAAEDLATMS